MAIALPVRSTVRWPGSAEQLYQRLTPQQRGLAAATAPDGSWRSRPPTPDRSAPTSVRDPLGVDDRDRVLDLLVSARLVTADDATSVGLAHEALTRAWPRLRTWLEEDAEGQRLPAGTWRPLPAHGTRWAVPTASCTGAPGCSRDSKWQRNTPADLREVESAFLTAAEALADAERRRGRCSAPAPRPDRTVDCVWRSSRSLHSSSSLPPPASWRDASNASNASRCTSGRGERRIRSAVGGCIGRLFIRPAILDGNLGAQIDRIATRGTESSSPSRQAAARSSPPASPVPSATTSSRRA